MDEKKKWYSHEYTSEKVEGLEKSYARVENADFSVYISFEGYEYDPVAIHAVGMVFRLDKGYSLGRSLMSSEDIKEFFLRTNSKNLSDLEGKVVEVYEDLDKRQIGCISVNPNLISEKEKGGKS